MLLIEGVYPPCLCLFKGCWDVHLFSSHLTHCSCLLSPPYHMSSIPLKDHASPNNQNSLPGSSTETSNEANYKMGESRNRDSCNPDKHNHPSYSEDLKYSVGCLGDHQIPRIEQATDLPPEENLNHASYELGNSSFESLHTDHVFFNPPPPPPPNFLWRNSLLCVSSGRFGENLSLYSL